MAVPISEPIVAKGAVGLPGAVVLGAGEFMRERKRRNQPPKTRKDLESALDTSHRIAAISAGIRRRSGLRALPENDTVRGWRTALEAKGVSPAQSQSLLERAEALAKARAKVEAQQRKIDRETREVAIAARTERKVGKVAEVLDISRQRIYQLA